MISHLVLKIFMQTQFIQNEANAHVYKVVAHVQFKTPSRQNDFLYHFKVLFRVNRILGPCKGIK